MKQNDGHGACIVDRENKDTGNQERGNTAKKQVSPLRQMAGYPICFAVS